MAQGSFGKKIYFERYLRAYLGSYLINHVLEIYPGKRGLSNFNWIPYFNHQFRFYNACNILLDPFSKFGIWIQGLEVWVSCHQRLVFQIYLEDKGEKIQLLGRSLKCTLSLILGFNLRLGAYTIWSAIFVAPLIEKKNWRLESYSVQKIIFWGLESYLGQEHLAASKQPRKYSGRHIQDEVLKNLKITREVLESLRYWATKCSGTCQR